MWRREPTLNDRSKRGSNGSPARVSSSMEILMAVETDLFEHREVKPHFINPCCFGEDFAA
jgi:hypothetical protein